MVKYLYNREDLKSDPQHPHKKPGMVACISDVSDGKAETGTSTDFVSKTKSNKERNLWLPHTHANTCMYRHTEHNKVLF